MQQDTTLYSSDSVNSFILKNSLYDFVQEFWDIIIQEPPVWNWHIKLFCDEAQALVLRLAKRQPCPYDLIINVPPGTTKSAVWSQMLPAWAWVVDPTLQILTISYADDVAIRHALRSRDIIASDRYRSMFPQVRLRSDQAAKGHYMNTRGGLRYSAGIGGSITGMHFHLIGIDDPLNPREAASDLLCRHASDMIDNTLTTRKVDKLVTATCLIMQRLNENDPTAHLLDKRARGKRIRHICLPAEARDGVFPAEYEDKYVDGLLDPVRLNRQVLQDALVDLGSANYSGQFAQRPAPAKGLIWQKWFVEVDDNDFPSPAELTAYGTDWDTAYTEQDDNAASAYITSGRLGNKIYIDDLGWDWLEFPALIAWIRTLPAPHYIEAKASGKSIRQTLVQQGIVAIEIPVQGGDKIARANMATPIAQAGMVCIRRSLADRLYNDPKQGILKFPSGKFRDLADVLAQALQRHSAKTNEYYQVFYEE